MVGSVTFCFSPKQLPLFMGRPVNAEDARNKHNHPNPLSGRDLPLSIDESATEVAFDTFLFYKTRYHFVRTPPSGRVPFVSHRGDRRQGGLATKTSVDVLHEGHRRG